MISQCNPSENTIFQALEKYTPPVVLFCRRFEDRGNYAVYKIGLERCEEGIRFTRYFRQVVGVCCTVDDVFEIQRGLVDLLLEVWKESEDCATIGLVRYRYEFAVGLRDDRQRVVEALRMLGLSRKELDTAVRHKRFWQ